MAEALLVTGGQHKSGKAPYLRAVDNVNTDITSPKTKTAVPEELVVACQLVERRAGDGCDGCVAGCRNDEPETAVRVAKGNLSNEVLLLLGGVVDDESALERQRWARGLTHLKQACACSSGRGHGDCETQESQVSRETEPQRSVPKERHPTKAR